MRHPCSPFAFLGMMACLSLPAAAATSSRAPARATLSAPRAGADSLPARRAERATPRMLEDIRIEGDIPVPQVLFITAREQRRSLAFHHRRYLRTSSQLGDATPLPNGIVVTRSPVLPGKEPPR